MTDRVTIAAEPRAQLRKQTKKLRRDGYVPGVVYGQREALHVQMSANELRRALRKVGTTHLADLDVAGDLRTVLVREIQQHPTRGDLIHIDFYEVNMLEKLTAEVELVATGEATPTKEGLGVPVLVLRSVEIECRPDALISELLVDFSLIQTPDDVIYVKDLVAPVGVEILTDPEIVVTNFQYAQTGEEETDDYAPAADAVEVIGRGKKEDEFDD
ncbi:MAG: 50S ribosomal protein L25 [Anaerolineales bacterium]|nr:50S ribosomal protein L25 [Anaerolineales bacterium]